MQDFIASNYQLFLQRSTNGQVLAYVIIFVVIFFITMFSLLGLLSKEYTVPLNPIVSFLIWAIALAFMFFAVFLLWDNEGSSIAYCQEIYGEKVGNEAPFMALIIAGLLALLAGVIAYYYWHNHAATIITVALSLVIFIVVAVHAYKDNIGAGLSLLPMIIFLSLVLLKVIFKV
jgi:amino acid transporter